MEFSQTRTSVLQMLWVCFFLGFAAAVSARAETIDDKVFLQGHFTGESSGMELALAAPPLFPTPGTLILPVLIHVNESVHPGTGSDTVGIRQVEPGFIFTQMLSPRWDVLVTQNFNWRKAVGASFSWGREVSASGVYTFAYYPRDDHRYFYLIGATLTNEGYRNQWLPALAVIYESEDRSRYFELGAPYSNLLFRPWPRWELGVAAQFRGAYFHLGAAEFSVQDARAEYLNLLSLSVGPSVAYQFAENCFGHFKAGVEFLRTSAQWDQEFEEIAGSLVSLPATWYVKVGLGLRFLDERKR